MPTIARRSACALVLALFVLLGVRPVQAQPTGGQVVSGSAAIAGSAGALTITQTSARAIINWQDFSLGAGQLARFVQPDATSATLNRVVSGIPSTLAGSLQANGQVYLINPNGILIGAQARIDTAGFLASTLDVANQEFLAGGDLRFSGGSTAAVTNLGTINALGGDVFLIARQVENAGSIAAANGAAGLAAGSEILLTTGGEQRLFVQAAALPGAIVNAGSIAAASAELKAVGGNAYALAINNSGIVRATGVGERNGVAWLVGTGGEVVSSGTVAATSADGTRGGEVRVLGDKITLPAGATVDVSGTRAGGTALIGGDWQGKNSAVPNARTTTVAGGVELRADGGTDGAGGKIVVWADGATRFAGAISARGFDGGVAEVSGKGFLDFRGTVDLTGFGGRVGSLLLDPTNLTIGGAADVNGDSTAGDDVVGNIAAGDFPGANSLITAGAVATLLGTTDLSLAATNNITVNSAVSWNSAFALTLSAGNAVNINAGITNPGTGRLTLVAGGAIGLGAGLAVRNITFDHGGALTRTAGTVTAATGLILQGAGDVGTSGVRIPVTTPVVSLDKSGGNSFITDTSAVNLSGTTGGDLTFSSNGAVNVTNALSAAGALTLAGTSMALSNDISGTAVSLTNTGGLTWTAGKLLTASTSLTLLGAGSVGTAGSNLLVSTPVVALNKANGDVFVTDAIGVNFSGTTGGNITFTGNGGITVGSALTVGLHTNLIATGDVTLNADYTATNDATTLTVQATNHVNVNAAVSAGGAGINVVLTADSDGSGAGNVTVGADGQISTYNGSFYAGLLGGGKKGQNFTVAPGGFINTEYGPTLNVNVNGAITLAANSLRGTGSDLNTISLTGASIATSNAVAATPDIATTTIVRLDAGTIGSVANPLKISAGASPYATELSVVNLSGNSYVNQVEAQAFGTLDLTVGSQVNSIQNIQIMNDAGGNGTTGTGHVILQTDGAGLLNIATNNIKTAGGGGVTATNVKVSAPSMTFADLSVNTGTATFTAAATGTLSSIEVNGTGDISAPTVTFIAPQIGTATNPLELGLDSGASTLNVVNTGGSTFIKSVRNGYTNIFLTNVKAAGTHAILFNDSTTVAANDGDHIDYTTDGSAIFVPTIGGGASDGVTFGSTTGMDVTRRNRNITLTAASGNIIFDDTSVNTRAGKFTGQIPLGGDNGFIAALNAYNSLATVPQITAGNVEFNVSNSATPAAGTIGAGGKDIQIAQGAGTSNNTLTINTLKGNVVVHELSPNHFKTLNVILNDVGGAQNVAIDLNGPDDVNFSENASRVLLNATAVNLSANNRNWNLNTPSRAVQIDGNSLGSGSYTINAGKHLDLNSNVLTNGGAISLTSDDVGVGGTGIHLLQSIRIDSNADDTGNSASTGAAGAITVNGTFVSSTAGSSRTMTVDSSSSSAAGGEIVLYSGAKDRDASGAFVGEFLTGLTVTAKGSTDTNDGNVYLNWSGSNYYLNGNFSSTGTSFVGNALVIDTHQSGDANGGSITFAGKDLSGYYSGALDFNTTTTAAGRSGGNVDLAGTFSHSAFVTPALTINTLGGAGGAAGTIALPAVTTTYTGYTGYSGAQNYTGGVITLNGNLTSDEGAITLTGDTRLATSVVIDTWQYRNDIQTGTAGAVTIAGTGVSALAASSSLTIDTTTNTTSAYFNDVGDPLSTELFTHHGGNVALTAGNAGGAYIDSLSIATAPGGAHNNTTTKGTMALNTVGTEGSQTYTGGTATVSGSLTTNGGAIGLGGAAGLLFSGAAIAFDTDRVGGTNAAGALNLGAHALNGPRAITIDLTADGGGAGAALTLVNAGAVTPLTSLQASAAALTVNGSGIAASGDITLEARGASSDLTLNAGVTSANGNLALVAGRNFINNVDEAVLSAANGRWLVYSTSPAGSTENGLTAAAGSTQPRLYAKTYALNAPGTIDAGNHLIYSAQPLFTVTADNQTRNYGDANPGLTATITGFVSDDGVTDTLTTAGRSGAPGVTTAATATSLVAGSPYAITPTLGSLASTAGYGFSLVNGALTVSPRPVTVTATAGQTKIYGNADPASFAFTNSGLGSGIALSGALARAAGETVQDGPYAIEEGTLTNANNANYAITYVGNDFAITARPVTVTATPGQTKVYGNADPALAFTTSSLGTGMALSGALARAAGETVAGGPYAIGQGTVTNANNANYTLTYAGADFTISKRPVTVTASGGQTKVYGNADPTFAFTTSGLGTGLALSGALNRAAGETVAGGPYAIGQGTVTDANNVNYTLTYAGADFGITKRAVTVTADAATKVYGNADPGAFTFTNTSLGSGLALSGALTRAAGETVAGGPYAIGQGTVTDANNANYTLTYAGANFTISKRPVTVTASGGQTKVYGNADPAFAFTTSSLGTGLALSGALTRAAGETVAGGPYAIGQGTVTDANNANYTLTYASADFGITKRAVTVTADAGTKVYGNADPGAFTFTNTSLGTGLALSGALTRAAGETVAGGPYAIGQGTVTDANNANYTLTYAGANFTISKRPVTVTASGGQTKVYGNADPTFAFTTSGLGTGLALSGALNRAAGETVAGGPYAIGQGTVTDANNVNYTLTYAGADFGITKRAVTVTADAATKVYGNADPGAFTFTNTSLGTGLALSGALTRAAGETVAGGPYAIGQGTVTDANNANYTLTYAAADFTISKRPVTVTASGGQTKVYGNADPAFAFTTSSLGTGLALSGALTRAAGETVAGGPYAIGQGTVTDANNANYTLTYASADFGITKRAVTVTADAATKVYGNADPGAFTFTNTSLGTGLALSGALTRAAGETVAGGPYAIGQGTVTDANNANYTLTYAAADFTISKRPVTVTADAATKVYGNADPGAFTFTNTSLGTGLALSGALTRAAGETVAGGPYAIGQGTVIDANNANYTLTYAGADFTISKRPVTVTASGGQTKVYGSADPTFAFTTSSLGTGLALSGALTRAAGETVAAGPYAIGQGTVTDANNANYTLAYVGANFAITPATLTYVATPASRQIGDPNPALTGSVTGFVAGDVQGTATTGTLAFGTTATNASPAGTFAIDGSGLAANNGNYVFVQAAPNATAFTITSSTQVALTITADSKAKSYGAVLPAFTASYAGFINGDTEASVTGLQFSTTATIGSNVGTYAITPFGAAAPSSYFIGYVPGTLTINPAALTLTANSATRLYGVANPVFDGTFAGFVNGDTAAIVTGAQYSTTATTAANVGSHAITPSGATASNYAISFVPGTLTIDPATLTYVATPASRFVGAADPAYTGTVTGFVNGETPATATTGTLGFATTATSASPAGVYPLLGSGLTANHGNYVFVQASPNFTALTLGGLAPLTIAADNQAKLYGAAFPAFTATITGLLNGDTASSVTGLQFSTTATIGSNVGTYTITPFGATAPASYVVGYVAGTLTINPAALTLTATNASRVYGAANPAFASTLTGLVNGDSAAVVTGAQFSTTATPASNVGGYAITPSGASALNYTLTFVPGTLTINPALLTITAASAAREFGAVNPAFGATFNGFVNGDSAAIVSGLAFNTPATTTSPVGLYAITPLGATAPNYAVSFVNGALTVTAPTVTTTTPGSTPTTVVTVDQQPAVTPDFAVIAVGDRVVLVPVDTEDGVVTVMGGATGSVDDQLALTLGEVTGQPTFGTGTGTATTDGASVDGVSSTRGPNFGSFELVSTLGSGPVVGGVTGGSGGIGGAQMNDPGLFRESTVNMGGFNIVYHEALADVRQQTENNTALGSSYREFSDEDDPQVNLVRAKIERKPADAAAGPGTGGAL